MPTSKINSYTTPSGLARPVVHEDLVKIVDQMMLGDVMYFTNAGERTAVFTTLAITPPEGALSYLRDTNRYYTYNGTGWACLTPITYESDVTSTLTLSTTEADFAAGGTITFTTGIAGALYVAHATFDCYVAAVSGAKVHQGRLSVDGVVPVKEAVFSGDWTGARGSVAQQWRGSLANSGSHTIKLRARQDSAGGTYQMIANNTSLQVTVYEVV